MQTQKTRYFKKANAARLKARGCLCPRLALIEKANAARLRACGHLWPRVDLAGSLFFPCDAPRHAPEPVEVGEIEPAATKRILARGDAAWLWGGGSRP